VPDKSDLRQGTLDLLILQVVTAGAIHGYGLAQRLQQISRNVVQVPQGSLYPALHRLENRGLLTADWKLCFRTARSTVEVSLPLTVSRSIYWSKGTKLEIGGERGIRTVITRVSKLVMA
jgi:PadR family transcriptional regulator